MMKNIHFSPAQFWEAGAQRCAGFAQFWEAECTPASHLFIDDQSFR
jgi:hypothetical protein